MRKITISEVSKAIIDLKVISDSKFINIGFKLLSMGTVINDIEVLGYEVLQSKLRGNEVNCDVLFIGCEYIKTGLDLDDEDLIVIGIVIIEQHLDIISGSIVEIK